MHEPSLQEPPATETQTHRLDPAIRALWRIGAGIWWVVFTAVAALALLAAELPLLLALLVPAAGIAYVAVVPGKRYARYAYRVDDVELRIHSGWIWRGTSVVLHSRVQHVDTRQGPIERALGLATVVVFTAGSVGAMVAIPGLRAEDAEALRDRLVALSGAGDAV